MIKIVDWARHQHFKDRDPIWIKIYRNLLHQREWRMLSGDAAKLLIDLTLLAATAEAPGEVKLTVEELAWETREPAAKIADMLRQIQARNFILISDGYLDGFTERYQDDVTGRYHDDIPRALAREENILQRREEKTREANPRESGYRTSTCSDPEGMPPMPDGAVVQSHDELLNWLADEGMWRGEPRAKVIGLGQAFLAGLPEAPDGRQLLFGRENELATIFGLTTN